MIKYGIVSDIHSEFWGKNELRQIGGMIQHELRDADIILLAGDIGSGAQAIKIANHLFPNKPICQVAGNHEYYGEVVDVTLQEMHEAAAACPDLHFLDRDVYINSDFGKPVRVIGATLWTDFELYGTKEVSMLHGSKNLADYSLIYKELKNGLPSNRITPEDTLAWHLRDKEFIQQELDKPFDGATILLTHHAMGIFAEHPQFIGGGNSPCFISNLDDMITDKVDMVVWGHTHHSVNAMKGNTRLMSSQVGYLGGQMFGGSMTETGCFGTTSTF